MYNTIYIKFAGLAAALMLLAAGCRSSRDLPQESSPASPAEAAQADTPREERKPCLQANFTCNVEGTSVSGQVRWKQDSLIWIYATKIIELGRAIATPDSVKAYAKIGNLYFRGTYQDLYQRTHVRLTFDDLQEMLATDEGFSRLTALVAGRGLKATAQLKAWKELESPAFPFYIPAHAKKL